MITDRFMQSKWGVMVHLLERIQNNPDIELSSEGKSNLYLYYTGDGPYADAMAGQCMGFHDRINERPVSEKFVRNWATVLNEYALRYKGKVKGWWIDGCYDEEFGYTENKLRIYHEVLKNADAKYSCI